RVVGFPAACSFGITPSSFPRSGVSNKPRVLHSPNRTMVRMAQRSLRFAMPKAVRITGRSSSITNSFVNGIVPIIKPSEDEIDEALGILGMHEEVVCSYCGDAATEWDHLRPLVENQRPTGYIHEINNLVPACGKCNQSKGNKHWRDWMFGPARLSPKSRGVSDLENRAAILERYEQSTRPVRIDFLDVVGEELWAEHWNIHRALLAQMRHAERVVEQIRQRVAARVVESPPAGREEELS